MAGNVDLREQATPLISTSQPAGSHQQVMSPTQGYGTVMPQSSQPPGRDGLQEHMHSATPDAPTAGIEGGLGFVDMAAGRARASIDPAEGVQHASTTTEGGILHGWVKCFAAAAGLNRHTHHFWPRAREGIPITQCRVATTHASA